MLNIEQTRPLPGFIKITICNGFSRVVLPCTVQSVHVPCKEDLTNASICLHCNNAVICSAMYSINDIVLPFPSEYTLNILYMNIITVTGAASAATR